MSGNSYAVHRVIEAIGMHQKHTVVSLLLVILCLFLSFDAGAAAGDYVIRRNAANTYTYPNAG